MHKPFVIQESDTFKVFLIVCALALASCKHEPLENNTYPLRLGAINATFKIPGQFKVLNQSLYDRPHNSAYNEFFTFWKENPELVIIIDSIDVRNQIYIDRGVEYSPINKKLKAEMERMYKKKMEARLRYEYHSNFKGSSLGSVIGFEFFKIKFHLSSDLKSFPNPNQYVTQYIITANGKSFAVNFHLTKDLNTDVFVKNIKVSRNKKN